MKQPAGQWACARGHSGRLTEAELANLREHRVAGFIGPCPDVACAQRIYFLTRDYNGETGTLQAE